MMNELLKLEYRMYRVIIIKIKVSKRYKKKRYKPLIRMTSNLNGISNGLSKTGDKKKMFQMLATGGAVSVRICKLKYPSCARLVSLVIKTPCTLLFLITCLRSSPWLCYWRTALRFKAFLQEQWLCTSSSVEVPDTQRYEKRHWSNDCVGSVKNDLEIRKDRFFWCAIWKSEEKNWFDDTRS